MRFRSAIEILVLRPLDVSYSDPTAAAPPDGRRTSQHSGISNITNQPVK
jgi:hypothetical protein